MARVQYGSIVTELKGKLQGQVFQAGNVGFVLRNKGYTPGISSRLRQAANSNLISNTTTWRNLSDSDRATWNSGTANWLFTNKFGATYQGSGFQVYNSFNTNRRSLGLARITAMPAADAPNNPGLVDCIVDDDGDLIISWDNVMDADCYLAVWASPIISAGRNINNAKYRRLGSVSVAGVDNTSAIGYGVDGTPYPTPPLNAFVIVKTAFYKGAFPYKYFEAVQRVQVTAA